MEKNDENQTLTPARRAEILERDWRPWAYALLGLRAPGAWEITVRPTEMISMVPEEICDSYSWKMHQRYLVSVLAAEKTLDGQPLWVVKPTMNGNRRGVVLRPSRAWPEETWDYQSLRRWLPECFEHKDWDDEALRCWEVPREDADALALLIDLLSAHLSAIEAPEERRLHLVE